MLRPHQTEHKSKKSLVCDLMSSSFKRGLREFYPIVLAFEIRLLVDRGINDPVGEGLGAN